MPVAMWLNLLTLVFASGTSARKIARQGPLNVNSTTIDLSASFSHYPLPDRSTTSLSFSPASTASVGTATVTNSANATTSRNSITTAVPSTCCYLWPEGVGINTWWSSSVNVTVATVFTTWLQYNNTLVPANSTTVSVVNATAVFGAHGVHSLTTRSPITPTATTTYNLCSGWTDGTSCTAGYTSVATLYNYTTYAVTSDILSGVPNELLPQEATLYGLTSIDGTTAATFPSQSLTVASPTPYYFFRDIELYTSWPCGTERVYNSISTYARTTIDGQVSYTSEFFPTYTANVLPSGVYPGYANAFLNVTVARAFPDGDYSKWNYTEWMDGITAGPAAGIVDAYTFELPDDIAEYFDSIPYVKSAYPDIGQCTPLYAGGEPTVHVPVNQLTATAQTTMIVNGNLGTPTTVPPTSVSVGQQPPVVKTFHNNVFDISDLNKRVPANKTSQSFLIPDIASSAVKKTTQPALIAPTTTAPMVSAELPTGEPQVTGDEPSSTPDDTPVSQATQPIPDSRTTTAHVGDIVASVIGLVPQMDTQDTSTNEGTVKTQAPAALSITAGNSVISAGTASRFVVGSQTLLPGGPGVVEGETTYQVTPSASAVVINGATGPTNQSPHIEQTQAAVVTPAITVGNSIVTADSSLEHALAGSQTLVPEGVPIAQAGTTYAGAPGGSAAMVNSETQDIAAQAAKTHEHATTPPQITVGSSIITANSASEYIVGSQTLLPGGSAVIEKGNTYSIASSGNAVVINGETTPIAQPTGQTQRTPAAQITIAGSTFTAGPSSQYVIGTHTLVPGGSTIVFSGVTLSLATSGSAVVVNGHTSQIAIPVGMPITIGGEIVTPIASGAYILPEGARLSAGGSDVVLQGTTYSLAPSGGIVIDGSTTQIPTAGAEITASPVGSAGSVSELILPGTTLLPGSKAVVSGTTYSLPTTGSMIYVNGKSSALPSPSAGSAITLANGIVATPTGASNLLVGSRTLVPGGSAVTISGTTYLLSGSEVIVQAKSSTFTEAMSAYFTATGTSSGPASSLKSSSPALTRTPGSTTTDEPPASSSTGGASASLGPSDIGMALLCVGFVMGLL